MVESIRWQGDRLELLDQRKLPQELAWLSLQDAAGVAEAIRGMAVRGAPAIGVAAAFGVVLAARKSLGRGKAIGPAVQAALSMLRETRPTAVNLNHALEQMEAVLWATERLPPDLQVARLEAEALALQALDLAVNRELGARGAPLLEKCTGILTHCNTGALATAGFGTALGMIRQAWQNGARFRVYADETRPYLQGARLTAWELVMENIPVTLLVDSSAAVLMAQRRVQAVLVGADRIAANGDVANKIGTYALALLAHHHGLPFYVAAPTSTLDPSVAAGEDIPIELRDAREVTHLGDQPIAPVGVDVFNPSFDVTPAHFITAIITEVAVLRPPFLGAIEQARKDGVAMKRKGTRSTLPPLGG